MKCRILIADDDPEVLDSLSAALSDAGANVVSATTGAELLERLAEDGTFDLIITDFSMPWMTGLEVAHSAREAGLDVPVIVMSGAEGATLSAQVKAVGGRSTLLHKPFDAHDLEAAMALMLPLAS